MDSIYECNFLAKSFKKVFLPKRKEEKKRFVKLCSQSGKLELNLATATIQRYIPND